MVGRLVLVYCNWLLSIIIESVFGLDTQSWKGRFRWVMFWDIWFLCVELLLQRNLLLLSLPYALLFLSQLQSLLLLSGNSEGFLLRGSLLLLLPLQLLVHLLSFQLGLLGRQALGFLLCCSLLQLLLFQSQRLRLFSGSLCFSLFLSSLLRKFRYRLLLKNVCLSLLFGH